MKTPTIAFLVALLLLGSAELYMLTIRAPQRVVSHPVHRVDLSALGSGLPITQSFVPRGDGLSEITFVTSSRAAAAGELTWALSVHDAGGWSRVLGTRWPITITPGDQRHRLRFPALEHSADKLYRLDLSLHCAPRCDTAVVASRDDAYLDGVLTVDGTEQWGDLEFEARTTGDTVAGRFALSVAPSLPVALSSVYLWAALLALLTVAVAAAAGAAVATAVPPVRSVPAGSRVFPALMLVPLLAALIATVAARPRSTAVDLLDQLYAARLEPTPAGLHWSLHQTSRIIGNTGLPALFEHAGSRVAWAVPIQSHMHLLGAIALDPGAWDLAASDGVFFRVSAVDQGREFDLYGQLVDPVHVPEDRRWVPLDVNLSRFAGRTIELRLTTEPSPPGAPPNAAYDWALWGAPRIEIVR